MAVDLAPSLLPAAGVGAEDEQAALGGHRRDVGTVLDGLDALVHLRGVLRLPRSCAERVPRAGSAGLADPALAAIPAARTSWSDHMQGP